MSIKRSILSHCPDIPFVRKALSRYKIHKTDRILMDEHLVQRVECGETESCEAAYKSAQRWPRIASKTKRDTDLKIVKAPDFQGFGNEQVQRLRDDIMFCRFAYGFIIDEYIGFHLMDKSPEERKEFISETDHMRFVYMMNDPSDILIFNDKMRTYEKFGAYYHREIISIESPKDYSKFVEYIERHPVFVKKQVYESCGKSIERIDANTCGKSPKELFKDFLSQEKVILEELVQQGEATAVFNPSSVNTIRCITFNTKHGVKAPYCFMKIGRAGSFVDNGGAGGILVGIDEKTGVTNTAGVDELRNIYDAHPDSGVPFRGHQLPEWDKLLSICKEMAAKIPSVPFIGWDLAYTDNNEWVVIEGNGMSQFIGPQTIWQRGIKAEVEQMMSDIISKKV